MRGLLVSVFSILMVTAAHGVCPDPTPKVCSEFFRSDAVVLGDVASETEIPEANDFVEGWNYQLHVSRVFRGSVGRTIVVHTGNDSGRLRLEAGHQYVLFATLVDGRLEISDDCGPLSDPAHTPQTLREIEGLRTAQDASIEGEVRGRTGRGGEAPRITVTVLGMGKTYRTVSDSRGLFRVVVPPGHYRVDLDPKAVERFDLDPIDLGHVDLVKGQCAQIGLTAP